MSIAAPAPTRAVGVVLVHWNQPDRLAATLAAFGRQGVPVEIVVVDNASTPENRERLDEVLAAARAEGLDVALVALSTNTGFGPGANAGWRHWLTHGSGAWVALAPHDALPDEGTLARMVELCEARGRWVGLACADVGDGETPVYDPYFGGMTVPAVVDEGWEDADYPHGTLLLARRGCLEDVGLFDERYFAYCEEADLGLRAKAAGWDVGLARGVGVRNPTMRSGSPVTDYLMHRNTLLLVREHSGRYHAFVRLQIALWQLVRGLVQPSSRAWLWSAEGRARGIGDYLRGRFGPPPADLFREAGEPPGAGGA